MSEVSRDTRYDPNNPDHVDFAKAEAVKKAERELTNLEKVLSSPEGREFVWGMLERGGVFHSSFDTEALKMAYNEGKRSQGLYLLARITEVGPSKLTVLQREAQGREIEAKHKWEMFVGND